MQERIEVVEQQQSPEISESLQKISKEMELVKIDVEEMRKKVNEKEASLPTPSRFQGAMILALYYAVTISSAVCSYLVIRLLVGTLDNF